MMISVIVATYNWPEALRLSLQSLACQTDLDFEILVADDGSRNETKVMVEAFAKSAPVSVRHLWHEDLGFRKTQILNAAIKAAAGDYLVFLDGDCIVQPDFIARHRGLSQPNHLVTGSRILLGKRLTARLCAEGNWDYRAFLGGALGYRLRGEASKFLPLFFRVPRNRLRDYRSFVWRRIKGCNLACWKSDAADIGGFDESMTGWGHEDADFVLRLQDKGVIRRSGAWATEVLHLWHEIADRGKADQNRTFVMERIRKSRKH